MGAQSVVGNYFVLSHNSIAGACCSGLGCALKHDYTTEERQLLHEYLMFVEERKQRAIEACGRAIALVEEF